MLEVAAHLCLIDLRNSLFLFDKCHGVESCPHHLSLDVVVLMGRVCCCDCDCHVAR